MSETLVKYVAEQIGFTEPLGKKGTIRNIEKPGIKNGLPFESGAPHLLLLCTDPLFLDESDRDLVRNNKQAAVETKEL